MSALIISFHGGDATKPGPINTLGTFLLGAVPAGLRELRGFVVGPDGLLYVVNGYKDNSLVLQFNGPDRGWPMTYLKTYASEHLSHPFDLEFGPDGHLYVSNQDSNDVTRYEGPGDHHPGKYKDRFVSGIGAVRGIACDGTYWYVADETGGPSRSGAVLAYDLNGQPVGSLPVADPVHLLCSGGYVYVGSGSGNQVLAFRAGELADAPVVVVGPGLEPSLDWTGGLAIPNDGSLFVASRKGRQILRFPLSGPTTASQGTVFLDALPDEPEFIGFLSTQ